MIPGIETLLGSLLGGAFRLGQAVLEAREKQRDRDHEHRMAELHGDLAAKADERRLRELGLAADMHLASQDAALLTEALQAQSRDAAAAGGFIAGLSASVRPILTYLIAGLYLTAKGAHVAAAWQSDGAIQALATSYTDADMAILAAILAYWYADRSLRRGRSPIAA
jgi:hypothetical protein